MKNRAYYKIVEETIARSIADRRLPAGTQLNTSILAERFSISRPPIARALKMLAERGLIRRVRGRGFMVLGDGIDTPIRRDLHQVEFDLSNDHGREEALVAPSWERILEEVEADVLNCIPFGTYMISETIMCQHYGVGRSVVRDVLARMHARRIVRKDRQSHWVSGPLSARMLNDAHELRRKIEPTAVAHAIERVPTDVLAAMRERLRNAISAGLALSQPQVDLFEADLHTTCVRASPNQLLADMVRTLQLAHVIDRLFGTYIGVHNAVEMLVEHRLVFDHMLVADRDGTEAALRFHLDADHERARARLKVLSVFDDPMVAPYLSRIY